MHFSDKIELKDKINQQKQLKVIAISSYIIILSMEVIAIVIVDVKSLIPIIK